MHKPPIVQVMDLVKNYYSHGEIIQVLKGINLNIYPGEMTAIMGPSGEGKSTLLYILGLLQSVTSGTYLVGEKNVSNLNRSEQARFRRKFAGFVFQSLNLFEHSTVYENLEFPLIYAGVERQLRPSMIQEALEKVNMLHRIRHPSNCLSGGEQQRVSIARAMVNRPQIIFADEPTGQLDNKLSAQIIQHFHEFVAGANSAIAIVTHDSKVADQCSRTYYLHQGYLQ
ncbi:hypothetical protein DSUL_50256 [Desulfovibrionales bacterium]